MYSLLTIAVALAVALAACGDNATRVLDPDLPPSISHSPESTAVRAGTYTLAQSDTDTVSWLLSRDGIVMIPLRGLRRSDDLGWITLQGTAAFEPELAVIDQVGNESLRLDSLSTGSFTTTSYVTHNLTEPLFIGSEGEFVWLKITANDAPVQLYSITWGPP